MKTYIKLTLMSDGGDLYLDAWCIDSFLDFKDGSRIYVNSQNQHAQFYDVKDKSGKIYELIKGA